MNTYKSIASIGTYKYSKYNISTYKYIHTSALPTSIHTCRLSMQGNLPRKYPV